MPDDVRHSNPPARMSSEEVERIRKLNEENRAKAADAARRQREKQMQKEEDRRRKERAHK